MEVEEGVDGELIRLAVRVATREKEGGKGGKGRRKGEG